MKWSRSTQDGITIHYSDEGDEVWKDHEWLDRKGSDQDGYTGPMRKLDGFMLRPAQGEDRGLFDTLQLAKAAAREAW